GDLQWPVGRVDPEEGDGEGEQTDQDNDGKQRVEQARWVWLAAARGWRPAGLGARRWFGGVCHDVPLMPGRPSRSERRCRAPRPAGRGDAPDRARTPPGRPGPGSARPAAPTVGCRPSPHPAFLERVTDQRAGHAVPTAAALAQLETLDGDDLDAGLAHLGDRVGVALVGDDHAGLERDDVVAVVPLLALLLVGIA